MELYHGWLREDFDKRDLYYKPPSGLKSKEAVNLRTDPATKAFATPIYDQEEAGSCVANASASAMWYERKKTGSEDGLHPDGPSRLFLYWNGRMAREKPGTTPDDNGTYCRYVMKSLDQIGACLECSWPYPPSEDDLKKKLKVKPLDGCFDEAKRYQIGSYLRLDPDRPPNEDAKMKDSDKDATGATLLDNVRACLSEGFPIVFGFQYYWGAIPWDKKSDPTTWRVPDIWAEETRLAYKYKPKGETLEKMWPAKPGKQRRHTDPPEAVKADLPGHAVLMVGYNDEKHCVLCQNSWGDNLEYQPGGLFWMPYAWITDFAATNDFWTVRSHKVSESDCLNYKHFPYSGAA